MTTITSSAQQLTINQGDGNIWTLSNPTCSYSFIESNTALKARFFGLQNNERKVVALTVLLSELTIDGTIPEDSAEATTLLDAAIEEAGITEGTDSPGGSGYLSFDSVGDFPAEGADGALYLALDSGLFYRWDSENEEYIFMISGLESYQNNAMSDPVMAYVYKDQSGNIYRVYEPVRNNDVMRGEDTYADSIDNFPFDNTSVVNCNPFIGKLTGFASGCTMAGARNYGGDFNFNSKTGCVANGVVVERLASIIFLKNNGQAIECTIGSTGVLFVGDQAEAINMANGQLGEALKFFVFIQNVTTGNNGVIKPDVTDSRGLSDTTIGNHVDVTLGGDTTDCTIGDGLTLVTSGNKSNKQFFNNGGTVYEQGITDVDGTLTVTVTAV